LAKTNCEALAPITAMPDIDKVAVPVLVSVTDCEPVDAPTLVEANERLAADRVTGGTTPRPLNAILCGEPAALSAMETAADIAPPAIGVKCPWMVQFAPTARLAPQVLAKINEEALRPATAMLEIHKVAAPVLVSVTDDDPLDAPTTVELNERLMADRVTGGETPLPLNAILCGEPTALPATVTAAVNAPAAIGAKWPWMKQFDPAAKLDPHVSANTN